jgi:hypothetical protein
MHGTAPLKSLTVSASLVMSAKFEAWAAQSSVSSGAACLLTRKHASHNGSHELRLGRDAGLRAKNNNNLKNEQKKSIFFSSFSPHRLAGHPFLADRLRGREGEESGENDKSKHCSSFFFFDVLTRLFSKGSPCLESRTRDFQTDLIC